MTKLYLCRHGETEWSRDGKHTGTTDLELTEKGIEEAKALRKRLKGHRFTRVITSPLKRAKESCELAGLGDGAIVLPDAVEWNYGDYEGRTTAEIQKERPGWAIFKDGCPGGETAADVGRRADRVIAQAQGETALFAHGHFLRVLAARWIGLDPVYGRAFGLDTAALSILGYVRGERAVLVWNDTSHLGTM
ncbi:MAG: histidine phosphatase family protein [Parachlamydiales bacterium]